MRIKHREFILCMAVLAVLWAGRTVQASSVSLEDGVYQIAVSMSGGSGRATIESPAQMTVEQGVATVNIQFSSPNYDYMRVGERTYYPVNQEGNSTFAIPVTAFDEDMVVVADTVAMSTPHEITYTLRFDSQSVRKVDSISGTFYKVVGYVAGAVAGIVILGIIMVLLFGRCGRKALWRDLSEKK